MCQDVKGHLRLIRLIPICAKRSSRKRCGCIVISLKVEPRYKIETRREIMALGGRVISISVPFDPPRRDSGTGKNSFPSAPLRTSSERTDFTVG